VSTTNHPEEVDSLEAPPHIEAPGRRARRRLGRDGCVRGSYQVGRRGRGNCRNIPQATDNIYTLASADVGNTLRVLVTAVNNDGAGTAQPKATDVVKPAPPQAPKNTTEPSISGTTQQEQTLTASPGEWSGSKPIQFAYRWRRCDPKGGDCSNTPVTAQTYLLASADVGHTLRVLVTASNTSARRLRSRTRPRRSRPAARRPASARTSRT
jgi:hypothetical protein